MDETEGLVFEPAVIENDSGLDFPIHLVEGGNGQVGIDLYNYLIEKYGNGTRAIIPPATLDENDEIYFNNEKVQQIVGSDPLLFMPNEMEFNSLGGFFRPNI